MKNLIFIIFQFSLVYILTGCNPQNNDVEVDVEVLFVDLDLSNYVPFNSVFNLDKLIPLKGTQDNPINKIKRLIKHEETFWILSTNEILITDLNGQLLRTISSEGEGPSEYQSLDDIRWNKSSQLMDVLDRTSGKLISYTQEGEFEKEWRNQYLYAALSFLPAENDYYIYGGVFFQGDGDRIILVSTETGGKLQGYIPIGKERNFLSIINNDSFYELTNDVEFFFSDNDTVYSISSNEIQSKYIFDFGKYKMPKDFLDRDFENIMVYRNESSIRNYVTLFNIQPTEDYYYLRFRQNTNFYPTVLNRATNEIKIIHNWDSGFGEEFDNLSAYFFYAPIGSDEQYLYASVDPYAVKSEIEKLKDHPNLAAFLEANPPIKTIYENFSRYENPYLLKLSIKAF